MLQNVALAGISLWSGSISTVLGKWLVVTNCGTLLFPNRVGPFLLHIAISQWSRSISTAHCYFPMELVHFYCTLLFPNGTGPFLQPLENGWLYCQLWHFGISQWSASISRAWGKCLALGDFSARWVQFQSFRQMAVLQAVSLGCLPLEWVCFQSSRQMALSLGCRVGLFPEFQANGCVTRL